MKKRYTSKKKRVESPGLYCRCFGHVKMSLDPKYCCICKKRVDGKEEPELDKS